MLSLLSKIFCYPWADRQKILLPLLQQISQCYKPGVLLSFSISKSLGSDFGTHWIQWPLKSGHRERGTSNTEQTGSSELPVANCSWLSVEFNGFGIKCDALPACHYHMWCWLPNRECSVLSSWKNRFLLFHFLTFSKHEVRINVVSLIYDNSFCSHTIICWRITGTDSRGKNVNVIILLIILACVSSTCLKVNVIEDCGFWCMARSTMWPTTAGNAKGCHVVVFNLFLPC